MTESDLDISQMTPRLARAIERLEQIRSEALAKCTTDDERAKIERAFRLALEECSNPRPANRFRFDLELA